MTVLNDRYRGKRYPTDVLSFPAPQAIYDQGWLGELILCLPVAKRQAKERNHSPLRELDILLVHGVLHLLGFDHEKSVKESRQMAAWERKLLEEMGLPGRLAGLIERNLDPRSEIS